MFRRFVVGDDQKVALLILALVVVIFVASVVENFAGSLFPSETFDEIVGDAPSQEVSVPTMNYTVEAALNAAESCTNDDYFYDITQRGPQTYEYAEKDSRYITVAGFSAKVRVQSSMTGLVMTNRDDFPNSAVADAYLQAYQENRNRPHLHYAIVEMPGQSEGLWSPARVYCVETP